MLHAAPTRDRGPPQATLAAYLVHERDRFATTVHAVTNLAFDASQHPIDVALRDDLEHDYENQSVEGHAPAQVRRGRCPARRLPAMVFAAVFLGWQSGSTHAPSGGKRGGEGRDGTESGGHAPSGAHTLATYPLFTPNTCD